MIRRPPRSTLDRSSAASDVYKRQESGGSVSDTATQNRLFFWYIQQAMWGRYSNSTESTLDHDLAVLEESGLDGLIADLELTRGTLRVRPEDFDTHTVGSRFHPILYMLTHVNDALDIGLWNWVTAVAAPSRQGLQPGGAPRVPKGAAVRRGLRTPAGQRRGQLLPLIHISEPTRPY